MVALGHERATLVGHSLGGGVAMQFSYQFPEMVERLVLVSSGGLGPEVSPVLRAAALPGADGHLPQVEAPLRFVLALEAFLAETEPASLTREDWESLIQRREAA